MHHIKFIFAVLMFFSFQITSNADDVCQSGVTAEFKECENNHIKNQVNIANKLYKYLRNHIPSDSDKKVLDENRLAWMATMKTECSLLASAFNNWDKSSYAGDTPFQYLSCVSGIAEDQVQFYKQIICPDTIETGEKQNCPSLVKALK